jgi:hypothetical protein
MITFSLKCFHDGETFADQAAFEMVPHEMFEFGTITFQCPDCDHEVILKIEVEEP